MQASPLKHAIRLAMYGLPLLGLPFAGMLAAEENETTLKQVVVTAPAMEEPLMVVTDPKAPRQPLPAHDGADYLKGITGFNVIRKGGTDGDPVFRGMAASRLNILQDGQLILGGCGGRMDPPTAYIYPESFDKVTVIKGPQSVLYGPVGSAGTVLFERDTPNYTEQDWNAHASATFGSFGRNDQVLSADTGNENFYVRGGATRSEMDDYKDGDGNKVHSQYLRWSADLAFGWTPDANTLLELSTVHSDGEAAYADRGMDGSKFERSNWGVKFERRNISSLVEKFEASAYYNYVDHVMDNYSLRERTAPNPMVSNPDRETTGLRLATTLRTGEMTLATIGVDQQRNIHTWRGGNQNLMDYKVRTRVEDARFDSLGVFGELDHSIGERDRIVSGLRVDRWKAHDKRAADLVVGGTPLTTAGESRDKVLSSGFLRHEHEMANNNTTVYLGVGHSQRFPDYWELISQNKQSEDSNSAFHTNPEKTTQLDVGLIHAAGPWRLSLSTFANQIDDFILVDTQFPGKVGTTIVRNIDAVTWGGEAGAAWSQGGWTLDGTLAYVKGDNTTDSVPLAQLPPLELRLGAEYAVGNWSLGGLVRAVAKQKRVDVGAGSIVGQDIDETSGFTVVSVNGSWKPTKGVLLSAGVDNLFDKTYAEHISRAGADVAGFEQTTRVNEPGRTLWVRGSVNF